MTEHNHEAMQKEYPSVFLMDFSPLWLSVHAIRKCWASEGKSDSFFEMLDMQGDVAFRIPLSEHKEALISQFESRFILGPKDLKLIKKVIFHDHTSTLEHVKYTFEIKSMSRGCLQELARHRHASLSVQSSRYTLKKILVGDVAIDEAYVSSGDDEVDGFVEDQLASMVDAVARRQDLKNDVLKYSLPEAFKTELVWTINARSLRNFLALRTSPKALWEIRQLAQAVHEALPEGHGVLYADCVKGVE